MSELHYLREEAAAFDKQVEERMALGLVPDLKRLRFVEGLYNNPWREPEFVRLEIMPKVDFVIRKAKSTGDRVLELGCGTGYLSLELARNGLHVYAVDISIESIEVAKKYLLENTYEVGFGSLNYEVADIASMDMGDGQYDSIVSFGTIHHMSDLESVIIRISKGLRPKGRLILCEPIRSNFDQKSAEFAAFLRVVAPTWESYEEKLKSLSGPESWTAFVQRIYNEYTYVNESGANVQSPLDNAVSSEEELLKPITKYFDIEDVNYSDAFIDKLIGGLRGDARYALARFLKFLDDDLIRRGILRPTSIWLSAVKK
jgi:SAM-dependent methyltransferase